MLKTRLPVEKQTELSLEAFELPGPFRRNGPALHVKVDGARVVERRTTEIKRLQRQFHGVVARPSRFQDDALKPWLSTSFVPAQQRWGPHLQRDVQAVCSEAGLSPLAAASVVAAASRGIISQNPGVLLSRLLTFQDCLTEPLGRRGVLAVLRSAPSLLRYSPESLRWNCDMLAALLPDGALPSVVPRAPMLLPASAMTLWGNFEGLRHLLRLDRGAALRLVVRAPRLLLNTRGALDGRLQDLALLAGEPSLRCVAAVVCRQPSLLGYFPGTLERNLRHLAALLAVPFSRVRGLLLRQPTLVMLSPQTVTRRVDALRTALRLDDPADLAAVVLRQPSVLTLAPGPVQAKVELVERVLGLAGRPPAELAGVLRAVPQVLTLAQASIEGKAAALRTAVAPSAALAEQLDQASPVTVALWLCMSGRRYEHVRAVAEGWAHGTPAAGPEGLAGPVTAPDSRGCSGMSSCGSGAKGPGLAAGEVPVGSETEAAGAVAATSSDPHAHQGDSRTSDQSTAAVTKRPRGRPKHQQSQPPPPLPLPSPVVPGLQGPQQPQPGTPDAAASVAPTAAATAAVLGSSIGPVRRCRGRPRKVPAPALAPQQHGTAGSGGPDVGAAPEPVTRAGRSRRMSPAASTSGKKEAGTGSSGRAPRRPSLSMLLRAAPVGSKGPDGKGDSAGPAVDKRVSGARGARAAGIPLKGSIAGPH